MSKQSKREGDRDGSGSGARDRPADGVEAQMQALQGIREEDAGTAGRHAMHRADGEKHYRSGEDAARPARKD